MTVDVGWFHLKVQVKPFTLPSIRRQLYILKLIQNPPKPELNTMDPKLYKYAKSGNVYFLKQLLNQKPSTLLKLTPQENTALHIAVRFGHVDVVAEICTQHRPLLVKPNLDGDTPLHIAARTGQMSIVAYLVRQIFSMSQHTDIFEGLRSTNKRKNTVLHEAVSNGHSKVARLFLAIDSKLVWFENNAGESPLYLAAREGMSDIVNQILISTTSPAFVGPDGITALHAAVIERHFDIMDALVSFKQQLVNEADHQGRTPLYYAAFLGDHNVVRRLLELNASTAYLLDKEGQSPMHIAASKGHTNVIQAIIQQCPDAGELVNLNGHNVLHAAVSYGQANVVRYILETKELEGLINQQDFDGNTPLHLAVMKRMTLLTRFMMWDGRVNQEAKNVNGHTAFDIDRTDRKPGVKISWKTISKICGELKPPCASTAEGKYHDASQDEANNYPYDTYKQMGQTLLMVAILVATITFAAAFTLPGGFDPNQGVAILQFNVYFKWFIVTDTIAMTCSITAACLLFWGAVISKESYVYYFTSASLLTYISLQCTVAAFISAIKAVMPIQNQNYIVVMTLVMGIVFHITTLLFIVQISQMISLYDFYCFFVYFLCKMRSKLINKR